jgi:hypothetical protein
LTVTQALTRNISVKIIRFSMFPPSLFRFRFV